MVCLLPSQQQNQTTRHFTNWLSSFITGKSNDPIKQQVRELGVSNHAISQLMARASELISKHADQFKIPFKKQNPSEKDVYKVLLVEWNLYHQSTATNNMVLLEQTKSQNLFNPDKHPTVPVLSSVLIQKQPTNFTEHYLETRDGRFINTSAKPLRSGIAIGAP